MNGRNLYRLETGGKYYKCCDGSTSYQLPFKTLHYNATLITILLTFNNCSQQLPCMVQLYYIYDAFVKLKSQKWSTVENVKDAKSFHQPFWFSHCIEYPRTSTNLSLASLFPLSTFDVFPDCLQHCLLQLQLRPLVSGHIRPLYIRNYSVTRTLGYNKRRQRGQNLPYPVPYLPSPDSRSCLSCSGPL